MSNVLLRKVWIVLETLPPQQTVYEVARSPIKTEAIKEMRKYQTARENKLNRYVIVEAEE